MKVLRNPFLGEGLSAFFSSRPVLISYLYYLIVLSALTFFWWPRGPLSDFLRGGTRPQTFLVVALGLFFCLAYMNLRFGAEDFAEEDATKVRDFVTLTPVPVATLIAGKLASAAVHILFLLALGAPFLLASLAVSGASLSSLGGLLLVAGASSLAFRCLGLFVFTIFDTRRIAKDVALIGCASVWIVATTTLAPPASPLSAILSLDSAPTAGFLGSPVPFSMISVIINLLAVIVLSAATGAWLRNVRRRFARRASQSTARSTARDDDSQRRFSS